MPRIRAYDDEVLSSSSDDDAEGMTCVQCGKKNIRNMTMHLNHSPHCTRGRGNSINLEEDTTGGATSRGKTPESDSEADDGTHFWTAEDDGPTFAGPVTQQFVTHPPSAKTRSQLEVIAPNHGRRRISQNTRTRLPQGKAQSEAGHLDYLEANSSEDDCPEELQRVEHSRLLVDMAAFRVGHGDRGMGGVSTTAASHVSYASGNSSTAAGSTNRLSNDHEWPDVDEGSSVPTTTGPMLPKEIELSPYRKQDFNISFNTIARLKLTELIHSLNPPPPRRFVDEMFRGLAKLAAEFDWDPTDDSNLMSQTTYLKNLRKTIGREAKPCRVPVSLESGSYFSAGQFDERNNARDKTSVVYWDFVEQLKSLLSDDNLFGNLDNLVVNTANPFGRYESDSLGEVLSGQWYKDAYAKLSARHETTYDKLGTELQDRPPMFVLPLMLFCDATATDRFGRFKSEPLMFTSAILKEATRNDTAVAWRPLGLLPPLDCKSSNARRRERQGGKLLKAIKHGISARNYHKCTQVILLKLQEVQKTGFVCMLRLGEQKKKVHCYIPIVNWLGDIKSQDLLSGRIPTYHQSCSRICWQCNCSCQDAARLSTEKECVQMTQRQYISYVQHSETITVYNSATELFLGDASSPDKEQFLTLFRANDTSVIDFDDVKWNRLLAGEGRRGETFITEGMIMLDSVFIEYISRLKDLSLNRVDSILNYLDYGDSVYGQFGALCPDLLHSFLGGIVKRVCVEYVIRLGSKEKELLEEVIDRIFLKNRSGERAFFHRMNFTHGATNLSELTHHEWGGLLLAIVVVSKSYTGDAILRRLTGAVEKERGNPSSKQKSNKKRKKTGSNSGGQGEGEPRDDDEAVDYSVVVLSDDDGQVAVGPGGVVVDEEGYPVGVTEPDEFVELAEQLLCLYALMNQKEMWKAGDENSEDEFERKCNKTLELLLEKLPRKSGSKNWNTAKIHLMLRRAVYHITRYGSMRHVNTELGERGLRDWIKKPAINTNRQSFASTTASIAQSLDESFLIAEANRLFGTTIPSSDITLCTTAEKKKEKEKHRVTFHAQGTDDDSITRVVFRGGIPEGFNNKETGFFGARPSYKIGWIPTAPGSSTGIVDGVWQKTDAETERIVPQLILNAIRRKYFAEVDNHSVANYVSFYTEMILPTGKRIRCHPNYQGAGPWFDYVLLREDPHRGKDTLFAAYEGMTLLPSHFYYKQKAKNHSGRAKALPPLEVYKVLRTSPLMERMRDSDSGPDGAEWTLVRDNYTAARYTPFTSWVEHTGRRSHVSLQILNEIHTEWTNHANSKGKKKPAHTAAGRRSHRIRREETVGDDADDDDPDCLLRQEDTAKALAALVPDPPPTSGKITITKGAAMATVTRHFMVADVPLQEEHQASSLERKFGHGCVVAKVLALFNDPNEEGVKLALVHCCRRRTMENYYRSSKLVTDWTLQYRYADDASQNRNNDVVEPVLRIVQIEKSIVDRVAALEEFPGLFTTLNPSQWNEPAQKYGLKPAKQNIGGKQKPMAVSVEHQLNKPVRRCATDMRRSVKVLEPMEHWHAYS